MPRVAVFIDYQNVYMGARHAFASSTTCHVDGQIDPLKLGGALTGMISSSRQLVAVHVYRGMPSSQRDPKGYSAALRQVSLWQQRRLVQVHTRPLNYRDPSQPREKGIDVMIAIDYVTMAIDRAFDIGVMFSADTDLVPALETVVRRCGRAACEVAYWVPYGTGAKALAVKGEQLVCHGLREKQYQMLHDPTDYNVSRRRR